MPMLAAIRRAVTVSVVTLSAIASVAANSGQASAAATTATPITHVIVLIGENRSFDHLFGTYQPPSNQSVLNLLSEGIVQANGSPGPNFARARQVITSQPSSYFIAANGKTPYTTLPAPTLDGAPNVASPTLPPFTGIPLSTLALLEPSLEPAALPLLTTGATGAAGTTGPDPRIANGSQLPNGPFQLTGPQLPYDSYHGDTIHRFYQMWQQSDCSIENATPSNPSGCLSDLYPFVTTTFAGSRDAGGGNPAAFYNMQTGDAPLLQRLAQQYTMSDNYHQPAMGGTAMQHVFMGTGDDWFWSDGNGNAVAAPASKIANPNPQPGTTNQYTVDGTFSDCSNPLNPGVGPIVTYLGTLPYAPRSNCAAGHYYMLNNTSPGFLPNGTVDTAGIASGASVPPSSIRTIGDELNQSGISWAYYGGAYNAAVNLANGSTNPLDAIGAAYCTICNFEAYATSIMGNATQRQQHIKDATDFFNAIQQGSLPAVSFVKPDELLDGHPQSSKLDLFEGMIQKILDTLAANPQLQSQTALFITFDEGGGYYDSGYIQPLDFFGDGPRIPLIVVSPLSQGGIVTHSYTDHVSILKFIERNWSLPPLTLRSRDNLPNPVALPSNPYVPVNGPAIGDLFDMFPNITSLTAAVLPQSRSVQVGAAATAFATIINAGSVNATGCSIALQTAVTANFLYQTTNAATNTLTGSPNTTVNIAAGASQSFLIALTPTAAFAPTNVAFSFACTNATAAQVLGGVNTLALAASTTPVPDIVALAASPDPGFVDVPGATGSGAFAVATANLGAAATITAAANVGSANLPVTLTICQTNPSSGACLAPPAASVTTSIAAGATPTFAIFATGSGSISNAPATNRVFATFTDAGGTLRGETSVAIRTQ